jgi:two-component system, cell cycle response regulator
MKCLIVEDDPVVCFMVEQAVAALECESVVAADMAEGLRLACSDEGPELAIVGHAPPGSDAVEWCEALRRREPAHACHVILLVPPDEPFDLRRVTDAGIDDILVRPFQAIELELRVKAAQRLMELESRLESGERARHAEAVRDPVTGTLNQTAMFGVLRQECARAERDHSPLAVILVEVDDLATFREWHGNEMGDAVLVDVAGRMRGALRVYDGLGRFADAGFLATLPRCESSTAVAVADRIRALVAADPVEALGRIASVTVSTGVAHLDADVEGRPDRIVAAAAAMLAAARAAGGNRVEATSLDPRQ